VKLALLLVCALVAACASDPAFTTTTVTEPIETTTTLPATTTTAPLTELTLVAPPDGLIVIEPELLVLGLTSSDAEVTVNGQPAVVSGPTGQSWFEVTVTLSEGANSINVHAEESGSAPIEMTVEVRYLPDAVERFAFLDQIRFSTEVIADYAEFLTGQEAIDAAVEDGVTTPEEGVPNDYYIRNADSTLSELQLASDVVVILTTQGITEVSVPFDEWLGLFHEDGTPWDLSTETPPEQPPPHFGYFGAGWGAGYWLTIDGYFVVQIRQQWVP